jgi:hypothetical protein
LLGKKYRFTHNKTITWDVEILAETLTHYYVRQLNNGRRWNEMKWRFHERYEEIL